MCGVNILSFERIGRFAELVISALSHLTIKERKHFSLKIPYFSTFSFSLSLFYANPFLIKGFGPLFVFWCEIYPSLLFLFKFPKPYYFFKK